jgi:hypothetical protein
MKTLPLAEWLWPLATAAAALLTWFGPRMQQKTVALPLPLRPKKPAFAELPTDDGPDEPFPGDFCPVHNHEFHGDLGQECPGCREEWEQVWVPTEEDDQRRDDFSDQAEERAQSDAWYQDLIARSEGRDPHHPWRD